MKAAGMFARVDPEIHEMTNRVSARLGISKADFIERAMRELGLNQLGEDDVPLWWTDPVPPRPLELDSA
ncbi:MAG: hypothetical protein ACRC0L_13115 [Angustibacter sp.]